MVCRNVNKGANVRERKGNSIYCINCFNVKKYGLKDEQVRCIFKRLKNFTLGKSINEII